jgi:hypothetical protein
MMPCSDLPRTVNKYVPPEKYDTRSIKAKKVIKSGKVNPKDTSTW